MSAIKTVGDLRRLIENLDDDYHIDFRVHYKVPKDIVEKRDYKCPYDTEYFEGFECEDIGVSDKDLCLGVTFKEDFEYD